MGNSSNPNGSFQISSIPPGSYELVFSMIGYETVVKSVHITETSNLSVYVLLKKKVYEIDEIKVSGNRPKKWFDDLKLFKEKFIGSSSIPINYEIKNEYYIDFSYPEKNILVAKCAVPLEIYNYTLGYNIQCEIQEFEYDIVLKTLKQNYQLYFSEIDVPNSEKKVNQESLRRKIYKESIYFFFKSLIEDKISESGFQIFLTASNRHSSPLPGLEIHSANEIIGKYDSTETYRLQFDDYLKVLRYSDYYTLDESWILMNIPSVTIDQFGYPVEKFAYTVFGDWANSGIASYLPKNFILIDDGK